MKEQKRLIKLYGELGKLFGEEHYFVVNTPAEAIRALSSMLKGFKDHLIQNEKAPYRVLIGEESIDEEGLHYPSGASVIKIIPEVSGSKGGFFNVILGGALLGASFLVPGSTMLIGEIALSSVMAGVGASLMLGGISQMLTPQAKLPSQREVDNGASYSFDQVENITAEEGITVPVLYGKHLCGSIVIGTYLYSENK